MLRYWLVTAGAIFCQVSAGIVLSGLSMVTDPMMDDLWPNGEISRAQVQTFFTLLLMVAIAVMPIAGRVIGHLGGRKLLLIGGSLGAAGLAGMSTVHGMAGLYLFGALTGIGFGISVNFVPIILVNNWFERYRGLVMGLVLAGTGLGGILSSVLFSNLAPPVAAGGLGWRASLLIAAALFAAFAVIPALFLVVNRPSDVGLPILGHPALAEQPVEVASDESSDALAARWSGLTFGEAMRSGWFWLLYAVLVVMGIHFAMGQITQPFFANQIEAPGSEVTPAMVGMLMSMQMVGLIIAKPLLGALVEALGMIKAMILMMVIHALAAIALGTITYPASWTVVAAIALVGAGFATMMTAPLACSAAFGQRDFAAIYGVLGTAYMLGLAVGAVLWSAAGTIGASPDEPWLLYRFALKWSWVLSIIILLGYLLSIRGGRAAQLRLRPADELSPVRL